MSKEKVSWEMTLKNVLYYVDEYEQQKMLAILTKYEEKFKDNKIKNFFQKHILNTKKDYYSKVDYLIYDILECNVDKNENKIILNELLNEIKPIIEKAEKNFWQRLLSIFQGS